KQGKILLDIPSDSMRALMFVGLATGLGSNPIGLDRGAGGDSYVTRFDRNGNNVLVVFENWNYRSSAADNPAHIRTVMESFPPSTSAALPVVAEEGGRMLVDATDFFMRDWNDVAGTLTASNEGSYSVAKDRSSIYRPYTRAFPDNSEIDVALTFSTTGRPGQTVASIAPDGRSITLRQHVSFVRLPDASYRPRVLDPRTGFFGITFKDYAQPIQSPLEQRWISRHRLERVNPADPASAIRNPIIYYIDRGIPEPVRSATRDGAMWWTRAFDEAGLRGAFRVEDLPEGADPMDARYNVIQWENRNERGWSIGGSMGDPRTGEILKAQARMDSHRARTDYNLYAGLMGADAAAADTAFVLARIRQVTAHEIGHTLGIAHNYIASINERASVMDYPPPRVRLTPRGDIDISAAYGVGAGAYDIFALRWGYGIFPEATEQDSLRAIVADGLRRGMLFLSDADARPEFASDPRTNLWDDAASASEFLAHQMAVRRVAMSRFGLRNIRVGEPVALLQERFAPVYLMHRFAINSLAKSIGGMEYSNAIRGDGMQATRPVADAAQRAALSSLVAALKPAELAIPDTVLTLLGPRPFSYGQYVELFSSRTRPAFDELGAARTLAQMVVDAVLQRERAARLVQFAARSNGALTLGETIDALTADWSAGVRNDSRKASALRRVAQRAVADRLLTLASDKEAAPEVRAIAELRMDALRRRARTLGAAGSESERAHWMSVAGDFTRWLERRELPTPTPALRAPPGDPFGSDR
ncbi:MAG: zinc-dependent metalloprotease, partial [Gemmatimonadaceae bacterium]|nr:zinc-dependent metalloprotease [Gemmatimonadaceae bacterium]